MFVHGKRMKYEGVLNNVKEVEIKGHGVYR